MSKRPDTPGWNMRMWVDGWHFACGGRLVYSNAPPWDNPHFKAGWEKGRRDRRGMLNEAAQVYGVKMPVFCPVADGGAG